MANDYRSPALKPASDTEMAKVLAELVETGQVSAETVNNRINSIREKIAQRANTASENNETHLSSEQQFLQALKTRFDALPQLHEGIQWADIEKSLKADPQAMKKLQALDEKGHSMNVFGEENGEFIFASAWNNYSEVSEEHRNIVFDKWAQRFLAGRHPDEKCNGNATDIVRALGSDLADEKFHAQLRQEIAINGWAWLKTDAATRRSGYSFMGSGSSLHRRRPKVHRDDGSFRAELRVKKVSS